MTNATEERSLEEQGTHELGFPKDVFNPADNMEGVEPRLPQIGIVHQAQLFKMPDGETTKEFEGILLDTNRANAYWSTSFDESGGGDLPDCSSLDGIASDPESEDQQSEQCYSCNYNQFKTAKKGGGKACKNMKRMHILMGEGILPYRLTLPPSSLKAIDLYISMLTSQSIPYQLVTTKFSLKLVTNVAGIEYSEIVLTKMDVIKDPGEVQKIKKQYTDLKPIMRGQPIVFDEVG